MATLTPDFSSPQQNNSASLANPLLPTNGGLTAVANGVASAIGPGLWSGTPIRNMLGVTPAYAEGTNNPTTQGQNYSPVPNSSQPVSSLNQVQQQQLSQQQRQQAWTAAGNTGDVATGWNPSTAGGPSQDQINAAINDTYNASNQYLDQAQNQLQSDFPTVQNDINSQYGVQKGQLDVSNTGNMAQFSQNQSQADYGHETALAAARRLYSELRQGYQQRFGGASSAADASNQIANVEQQRQEGQQNRGYQDTTNQINLQRTNTENQYQQGIQALMSQRDTALNQANRDFQSKLLQISQGRAQNEAAKGQAKLQALQDLRNQIFSINQQNTQFQQTLEAQRQQSALQLQNYQALAGSGVNTANTALLGFTNNQNFMNPGSNLQAGGQQQSQGLNLTGAINTTGKTWDPITGTYK